VRRRTVVLATAGAVAVVAAVGAVAGWLWRSGPAAVATTTLGHDQPVAAVAFSPDGRTLAAAEEYGGGKPVVTMWDYRAATTTARFEAGGIGASLAFSPDGTRLVTGGYDSYVDVREVATGRTTRLGARAEKATAVAFGPALVASGGSDGLRLRDAGTGADGPALDGREAYVSAVAFSPDGTLLAAGGSDGVRLWNPATGARVATLGGQGDVVSVAFSPDGTLLATGGSDRRVRVWNVATRRLVHTLSGHRHTVASVAFTPDGLTLASADGSSGDPKADNEVRIRLWRVRSGTEVGDVPVGGTDEHGVRCRASYTIDTVLAISRDGTTLAANCGPGVRLWRLTGR
jgi:WD40 repeat protein